MKAYFKGLFILLISLFIVHCTACVNNILPSDIVQLASCIDGDTARFYIDGENVKVRFLAIDTPESTNRIDPYGKEASAYTEMMLTSATTIRLEYEESDRIDKYGRTLAWIFVDNILLQEKLVEEGYARIAYLYGDYKYTARLQKAEKKAKKKKLNIWSIEKEKSN